MNKKSIIEIVVVTGAFLASGIVLYNGFFASSGGATVTSLASGSATGTQVSQNVLPYGPSFDFGKIEGLKKDKHFQFGVVDYPTLNAKTEVGKASAADLIVMPQTVNNQSAK